ncbi:hypothetical protein ACFYZI_41805 [Streptomyces griseorubiginosus]|uniref:hypothetical protein n=1 Tax=Streptomyces griseorubiginosus TaxID=67304 RepID=UPI0036C78014
MALGSNVRTASGRRLASRSVIVLSLVTAAALMGNGASAEPAPPSESQANPEVSLNVGGAESPQHIITCALFANKPNYSGGKITGTGGISGCVPSAPDACSSEADVEVYLSGPGWVTAGASSRQHKCPPPARSSTATVSCDPSSTTYSYRTVTLGTIVHEGTDSNTATSNLLNVKCL